MREKKCRKVGAGIMKEKSSRSKGKKSGAIVKASLMVVVFSIGVRGEIIGVRGEIAIHVSGVCGCSVLGALWRSVFVVVGIHALRVNMWPSCSSFHPVSPSINMGTCLERSEVLDSRYSIRLAFIYS